MVLNELKMAQPHFNAYTRNSSIVMQLILIELLSIHQILEQVSLITKVNGKTLPPLFDLLKKLLGGHPNDRLMMTSFWPKGPLSKLKYYSGHLLKNEGYRSSNIVELYNETQGAWLRAVQSIEFATPYAQATHAISPLILLNIKRLINELIGQFKRILKKQFSIVLSFDHDENVLYFILRRRKVLKELFKEDFFDKILKTKKLDQHPCVEHLIDRYIERGFEHLVKGTS